MPDVPPSCNDDRHELVLALLAVQLDFVSQEDLRPILKEWRNHRTLPLGQLLVQVQLLSAARLDLLDQLVNEYLTIHAGDSQQCLQALAHGRSVHLDLDENSSTPAPSGEPTLSTSWHTEGNRFPLDSLPPSVGLSTSSGKRFRILRPHAHGALGQVFLAQDEELQREVALKEMREPFAHHADSRARFLREAEITGQLEHPGIVPVYGLGRYPDGRPFYAMRFIRGQSLSDAITRFHEADHPQRDPGERALTLRGLLGRFVAVCNAVDFAHSRGVIHRDLKPSNIMLGPYGETLVVDWGLAKAFDRPMTVDSTELPIHPTLGNAQSTLMGQAVGTPAFMPPEQADGRLDQIGPRSDIYSLGATLYQLLTGKLPFDGTSVEGVLEQVRVGRFPPPRKVNPQVPAALEAIILKAMALRPVDRYNSVHELAQEVERWLADEPVLAYRESLLQQANRWARRHRSLMAGLGAVLLSSLFALILGLWAVNNERQQTAHERDVAQQNLELARKAVDECFEVATRHPLLQQERLREVRRLLLEKALQFYQGFETRQPRDPSVQFEVGHFHFRIAVITEQLGSRAEALASYKQACERLTRLVADNPREVSLRIDLARALNNLGVLHRENGQKDNALRFLEQARDLRAELVGEDPNQAEWLNELADTWINLSDLHREQKNWSEALQCLRQAEQLLAQQAQQPDASERCRATWAAILHNRGRILAESDRKIEAIRHLEQALLVRRQLVRDFPLLSRYRFHLAITLRNLGVLVLLNSSEQARDYFREALQLCEVLIQEDPDNAASQVELALVCNSLGAELQSSEPLRSLQLQRRALALLQRLIEKDPSPGYHVKLAVTCLNLGRTLLHQVQSNPCLIPWLDRRMQEQALKWFDRAAAEVKTMPEETDSQALRCRIHWARAEVLGRLGRSTDALAEWNRALQIAEPDDRLTIRQGRAFDLARAGQYEQVQIEVADLLRELGSQVKGEQRYDLACVLALTAKAVAQRSDLPLPRRESLANQLARQAVDQLERANAAPHHFFKKSTHREYLHQDEDLMYLRDREDYREFLRQLPP